MILLSHSSFKKGSSLWLQFCLDKIKYTQIKQQALKYVLQNHQTKLFDFESDGFVYGGFGHKLSLTKGLCSKCWILTSDFSSRLAYLIHNLEELTVLINPQHCPVVFQCCIFCTYVYVSVLYIEVNHIQFLRTFRCGKNALEICHVGQSYTSVGHKNNTLGLDKL